MRPALTRGPAATYEHYLGRTTAGPWTVARLAIVIAMVAVTPAYGQAPSEHEQHHPAPPAASAPTPPVTGPSQPSQAAPQQPPSMGGMTPGGAGGMAAPRMGEMMGGMMGGPPAKALYPSLMELPELTPERRAELERLARERVAAATVAAATALELLAGATKSGDPAAMQAANAQVRESLGQLDAGLALQRALAEARQPRDIALDWFRREMNLTPIGSGPPPHGLFGLSLIHYFAMLLLGAFAASMLAMYYFKMRRAAALVARLSGSGYGAPATLQAPGATPERVPVPSVTSAAGATAPPAGAPADITPSRANSWTGLLRVTRIFQETPDVKTFRLMDPGGGTLPFSYLPGQFLTLTVSPGDVSIKRSYTIASSPTDRDSCEITVKREEHGAVSRFLHDRVKEGDTLQITAPSGRFTFTGEEASSVVLIAGGVGVTPMMSVLRYLTKRSWPHEIFFLFGVHEERDVIYREELEYLQRRYLNLHLIVAVDDVRSVMWPYSRGRITRELIEASVPQIVGRRVHICGPPAMMEALKAILQGVGVPADQIRTEVFIGKERPVPSLGAVPASQTKVAVVTFAKSRRTAMLPATKTVLEASEDVGVNIDYSCRVGICGVCRVRLLSGAVTMEVQDGLEPGDKENNIVLACQAKSTADLAVDA